MSLYQGEVLQRRLQHCVAQKCYWKTGFNQFFYNIRNFDALEGNFLYYKHPSFCYYFREQARPAKNSDVDFFSYCGLKAWQNRVEANVDLKKPILLDSINTELMRDCKF